VWGIERLLGRCAVAVCRKGGHYSCKHEQDQANRNGSQYCDSHSYNSLGLERETFAAAV
jgi:hypothetical protein